MPEITRENILLELKKPLPARGFFSVDYLKGVFGVPNGGLDKQLRLLNNEVYNSIVEGLISVSKDNRKSIDGAVKARDMNYVFSQFYFSSIAISITPKGGAWLDQKQKKREQLLGNLDKTTPGNKAPEKQSNSFDMRIILIIIIVIIIVIIRLSNINL